MKTGTTLAILSLLFAALPIAARAGQDAAFQPGFYGNLILGYDPAARTVSASFSAEGGVEDDRWRCVFFLRGPAAGPLAASPPDAPDNKTAAILRATGPGRISLSLNGDLARCEQYGLAPGDTALLTLDTPRPYIVVRVIKNRRAYFYPAAQAARPTAVFVIRADAVGVLARGPDGWLQAEFMGAKGAVTGWLKETDFYPD